MEREDEPYRLLSTPHTRSASCIDKGVLRRSTSRSKAVSILVSVILQATLLSEERRHRSYLVALKVKAPPIRSYTSNYAPIDLVMVLNMSEGMTGEKFRMLKYAM